MADTADATKDRVVDYVKLDDVGLVLARYLAAGPAKEIMQQLGAQTRKLPALETTLYSELVRRLIEVLGKQVADMSSRVQQLAATLHMMHQDEQTAENDPILLGLQQLFSGLEPGTSARLRGIAFLLQRGDVAAQVLQIASDLQGMESDLRSDLEILLEKLAEKVALEVKELTATEPDKPTFKLSVAAFDELVDRIVNALVSSGVQIGSLDAPVLSGLDLNHYAITALHDVIVDFAAGMK